MNAIDEFKEIPTGVKGELEKLNQLLASTPQLDENDEEITVYRPLAKFSHLDRVACFPLRLIFDLYYRRELQSSPDLKQQICAFYSTLIQRKAEKSKEYKLFFDALVQGAKKTDVGCTVMTNDAGAVLGQYIYRGFDKLCGSKVAESTLCLNGQFIYPIKRMPRELLANIIYPYLEKHVPLLIKAARSQRKDIYLNDDFNFVVGEFAVPELAEYEIVGNNIVLPDNTKLYIYHGDI